MTSVNLESAHKGLLSAWKSGNQAQIKKQLDSIQNIISDPTGQQNLSKEALLTVLKDYYELNALYYVKEGDLEQFGQAIKECESFYETQQSATGGALKSEQQYLIYGLHLMYLLATNKIIEFHMLIEKIDYDKRKTDPFLGVPVKLEGYLMEGAYNSMNLTEASLPSPYYKPFMSTLKQGVQNEIAISLEMSYRSIPVKIAMKQLFLKDEKEALAFGSKRGWIRKGDEFLIAGSEANEKEQKPVPTLALASGVERVLQPLDSERIMKQCLHYASQLEQIV